MTIYGEDAERFGKTEKQVVIDKSDPKHPNRVIRIIRDISLIDNEYEYTFQVQGMEYMPTIKISKQEFKELIGKLNDIL